MLRDFGRIWQFERRRELDLDIWSSCLYLDEKSNFSQAIFRLGDKNDECTADHNHIAGGTSIHIKRIKRNLLYPDTLNGEGFTQPFILGHVFPFAKLSTFYFFGRPRRPLYTFVQPLADYF
jgi:hypothetical protein